MDAQKGKRSALSDDVNRHFQETIAQGEVRDTASAEKAHQNPVDKAFGRYRILKTLGAGAMGAVYLAHDETLDREVALKIPKFPKGAADTVVKRFYREARSAATLSHPNICPIFDVGEIDGTHYITMRYVHGHTLADYIKAAKPQPQDQAAAVIRKVALAMHEAHSHQVVHRDLKPANIMIDQHGEPVVMDFGLARRGTHAEDGRITVDGAIAGSPAYMSPEQLQGNSDDISPLSDVYNLGVVLYEVLTGQLPFRGSGSVVSVITEVMTKQPTNPAQLRDDLDPALADVCLRAMAKRPDERFGSMRELAFALLECLKAHSKRAAAQRWGALSSVSGIGLTTATTSAAASRDIERAREQCKIVRALTGEGQYAAAISILEKLAVVKSAEVAKFSEWAVEQLPILKAMAAGATSSDSTAADELSLSTVSLAPNIDDEMWDEELPQTAVTAASDLPAVRHGQRSFAAMVRYRNRQTWIAAVCLAAILLLALIAFALIRSDDPPPKSAGDAAEVNSDPNGAVAIERNRKGNVGSGRGLASAAGRRNRRERNGAYANDLPRRPAGDTANVPVPRQPLPDKSGLGDDSTGRAHEAGRPRSALSGDSSESITIPIPSVPGQAEREIGDGEPLVLPGSEHSPAVEDAAGRGRSVPVQPPDSATGERPAPNPTRPPPKSAEEILRELDENGDGKLSLRKEVSPIDRKRLFRADANGDSYVTKQELREFLSGERPSRPKQGRDKGPGPPPRLPIRRPPPKR